MTDAVVLDGEARALLDLVLASGRYPSADEAIGTALRLLCQVEGIGADDRAEAASLYDLDAVFDALDRDR